MELENKIEITTQFLYDSQIISKNRQLELECNGQ